MVLVTLNSITKELLSQVTTHSVLTVSIVAHSAEKAQMKVTHMVQKYDVMYMYIVSA